MTNGRSHGVPTLVALTLASAFGLFAADAAAQTPFAGRSLITFELVRPHASSDPGLSFGALNGAAVLGHERPLGSYGTLVVDVPLAWGSQRIAFGETQQERSGQAIGNPFVGLRWHPDYEGGWAGKVGVRIPLARSFGDDGMGAVTGIRSDLTRAERYLEDVMTFHVLAGRDGSPSGSTQIGAEAGLVAVFSRRGSIDRGVLNPETFGTYAWSIRHLGSRVMPGAGVRGQVYLGSDVSSTSDRFMNIAELHLGFPVGPATATASAGLPLKDYWRDSVPFILGIHLGWEVGR